MSSSTGTGHPVLGIVLGLIGILAAPILAVFIGIIGGGIALILGVAAICIGIVSKKNCGKGGGAVFFGIVAVILSVVFTFSVAVTLKELRYKAAVTGRDIAKHMNRPYLGLFGIVSDMQDGEGNLSTVIEQLHELNEASRGKGDN